MISNLLVWKLKDFIVVEPFLVDFIFCEVDIEGELHFTLERLILSTEIKFFIICIETDKFFKQFLSIVSCKLVWCCIIFYGRNLFEEISLIDGFDKLNIQVEIILLDLFLVNSKI